MISGWQDVFRDWRKWFDVDVAILGLSGGENGLTRRREDVAVGKDTLPFFGERAHAKARRGDANVNVMNDEQVDRDKGYGSLRVFRAFA